jgi:hypothetical protein
MNNQLDEAIAQGLKEQGLLVLPKDTIDRLKATIDGERARARAAEAELESLAEALGNDGRPLADEVGALVRERNELLDLLGRGVQLLEGEAERVVTVLDRLMLKAGAIVPDKCCDAQGQHYGIASVRELIAEELKAALKECKPAPLPEVARGEGNER